MSNTMTSVEAQVNNQQQQGSGYVEKLISVGRHTKVVKGGRRFSFSVIVVVGDTKGHVGIGLGKAREVPEAIRKAGESARKNLFKVEVSKGTFPHEMLGKFGAASVLLKPASDGTGVIAGGACRAVLEMAGIRNALTKSFGTTNPHNLVRATINGLRAMRNADDVLRERHSEEHVA